MADLINLNYQEVMEQFEIIYNNPEILFRFCDRHFPTFSKSLKKVKNAIEDVVQEKNIINSLGKTEIETVIGGLSCFPLLLLKDNQSPELERSCSAIILLLNNYLQLFPNEELQEVVESIYKLFLIQDRFSKLIVATDLLLLRNGNNNNNHDYLGINKDFVDAILNNK